MSETWLTRHPWCTRQSWRSPTGMSFWPAGRMIEPARVLVGHSTETVGFPGYDGGASAPHFTIDLVSGLVRQHIPLEWGSRCLAVSTGGVTDRTVNITGTIQVEVIGAVTPGYPRTYGHYDLPNRFPTDTRAQQHLARLFRAIHDETGKRIPLQIASGVWFQPHPASYGVRAPQRLTSAAFRAARGYVGHQNAPANSHGDGVYGRVVNRRAVDVEAVLALAVGTTAPPPADVTAPAGSTWEVDTTELNCRSGPGTQHPVIGSAERGMVVTATGRSSGPWIEAQTPYQTDHGIRAWWHSGFMRRVTAAPPPPKPDPQARRAQQMLADLGYDLGTSGVDGFWGPDSDLAARTYGADHGIILPIPTPIPTLLTHLEATMSAIEDLRRLIITRDTVTLREPTARMIGAEPGRKIPLEQAIDLTLRSAAYAHGHARAAEAHAAASEAALEALAGQTAGVDVEAVKKAAREGAAHALSEVRFDVTAASAIQIDDEED